MANILVIDEGTTGCSVSLFESSSMTMIQHTKVEFPQITPQSGWVEHNPHDIVFAMQQAFSKIKATSVECIGITNQRETVVAWCRSTGEILGNALVWQDRRTADFCASISMEMRTKIHQKTGLVCDPYFSASKMAWMLEHNPKVKKAADAEDLCFGTIDCYLIYVLTGGKSFVTEHTNASRTMLYALETGDYDQELLDFFKIPRSCLPDILMSDGLFGTTVKGSHGLPEGIPITGCLGDQQSALFGQSCIRRGDAKITFGTGAFLLLNTGVEKVFSSTGLLTTVAMSSEFSKSRTFALEGAAFIAGAAVQFLRDQFQWFHSSQESEALAWSQDRDPELVFIPALAGLGAPFWNPYARGVLWGLSRGSTKAQVTRAVLESIALQNAQLLDLMRKDSGLKLNRVGVDGGASANVSLMQFQSDVLQTELFRPSNLETTSLGAAKIAWQGFTKTEVGEWGTIDRVFKPSLGLEKALELNERWQSAEKAVHHFYSRSKI